MKTKAQILLSVLLLMVAGMISCSRTPSDAAIIADVQARIQQDAALAASQITVQSSAGVVVLSGSVASDAARNAAAAAARQAEGVKGLINNLQVAAAAAPPVAAPAPAPAPAPAVIPKSRPAAGKTQRIAKPAPAPLPAPVAAPQPAPSPVSAPQPPRPSYAQITIPEGTRLSVRLIDPVDTERNKEGDTFRASLDAPIVIANRTVIPKHADVTARLVSAKSAGRFTGSSSVVLVLTEVVIGDKPYEVQTGEFAQKGASRGGRTAAVIGGTAAAGAVIGAITGGGKGAAVGAAAGAGAGTAVQALGKGEQIRLPAESLLEFQLKVPLTVTVIG